MKITFYKTLNNYNNNIWAFVNNSLENYHFPIFNVLFIIR